MKFGGWQRCSLIDFPGHVSAVLFTKGCSFRCPFCHNPGLVLPNKKTALSEEKILAFLNKRVGKLDGIVISGGEPTIHEDLPDFIKIVKELGFKVKLDTNGNRPDILGLLIRKNLIDYCAMDIKASLARYEVVTKVPTNTTDIQQSVSLLMQSNIPYEFRTTLVKELHLLNEAETIALEIKGAQKYVLQQFRPLITLDPTLQSASPFSDDEMDQMCAQATPHVQECAWR